MPRRMADTDSSGVSRFGRLGWHEFSLRGTQIDPTVRTGMKTFGTVGLVTLLAVSSLSAAVESPLADAAERTDRCEHPHAAQARGRCERAAGRWHDGAALGGLSATTWKPQTVCWTLAPT